MRKLWKSIAITAVASMQLQIGIPQIGAQEMPDFKTQTTAYHQFVTDQINQLLKDTEAFATLIHEGKLEEAKMSYPVIRMAYERSEPIAESFGESDMKIDFRLVDYVDEKGSAEGWGGFHRIEQILWEDNTTKGAEGVVDQLVKDIKELKVKITTVEVTPDLMLTGAIDLLNEVSTSKITGEEEVFSHTDLYDFKANIEGAEKIFELFKDAIAQKDETLAKTISEKFETVNALLAKYETGSGHYQSYETLTSEDTKALAEAVTKLGEPLAQMAIIMEVQ